jgi:PTH1 family peptidyl-tRNA hydrolase
MINGRVLKKNRQLVATIFKFFGFFEDNKEEGSLMKYLIVGLGNVGSEYDDTRHNVGFEVVDYLADKAGTTFKIDTLGSVAEYKSRGRNITLLKPSTYMNRSGKAVNYWMTKQKVQKENVLIVLDDLNLDFGKIRLRSNGSDGGHNGLKDINQTLGDQNYARLRIGIGDNFRKGQQVDFVLGKWSKNELNDLPDIISHSADAAEAFTHIEMKYAMEKANSFKIVKTKK